MSLAHVGAVLFAALLYVWGSTHPIQPAFRPPCPSHFPRDFWLVAID